MLLVDDLAAGGTKNLRHTPRGLVTLHQDDTKFYINYLRRRFTVWHRRSQGMSRTNSVLGWGQKLPGKFYNKRNLHTFQIFSKLRKGKDQEWIQSSTTPDHRHHIGHYVY